MGSIARHEDSVVIKSKSKKNLFSLLAVFGLGALLSVSGHALTDKQKKDIGERVKPAGTVCLEGDSTCGGAVAAAGGKPKSGEEVYTSTCHMCHEAGVGGAPKMGDKGAWAPRIAQGVNTLHDHAIAGIRAMPPKGTCAACSDDEVKAAVDFMVSKSK
jgi:cytochrome c5